ncbi:MAG: DUF6036 family nucleotidyltransferase [Candidatus Bilamarchaeaceae archaeon]
MKKYFGKEHLKEALHGIGDAMDRKTDAFMLGGGAMCFRDQKNATKDLDLVFRNDHDAGEFCRCARKAGFTKPENVGDVYELMDAYGILERPDGFRLDIFSKVVCRALELSGGMEKRAEMLGDYGSLRVWLVSNEDVVLFKGITERPRDADDIASVIRSANIDWRIVLEECKSQSKMLKWYGLLYNKFAHIEEKHGIAAPIMEELLELDRETVLSEAYENMLGHGMGRAEALAELKKRGFTERELAPLGKTR